MVGILCQQIRKLFCNIFFPWRESSGRLSLLPPATFPPIIMQETELFLFEFLKKIWQQSVWLKALECVRYICLREPKVYDVIVLCHRANRLKHTYLQIRHDIAAINFAREKNAFIKGHENSAKNSSRWGWGIYICMGRIIEIVLSHSPVLTHRYMRKYVYAYAQAWKRIIGPWRKIPIIFRTRNLREVFKESKESTNKV